MLKVCWSKGEIEPGTPAWNARVLTTTAIETLFQDDVDQNKVSYEIKAHISPILHSPRTGISPCMDFFYMVQI